MTIKERKKAHQNRSCTRTDVGQRRECRPLLLRSVIEADRTNLPPPLQQATEGGLVFNIEAKEKVEVDETFRNFANQVRESNVVYPQRN